MSPAERKLLVAGFVAVMAGIDLILCTRDLLREEPEIPMPTGVAEPIEGGPQFVRLSNVSMTLGEPAHIIRPTPNEAHLEQEQLEAKRAAERGFTDPLDEPVTAPELAPIRNAGEEPAQPDG